jgi:hypothetical protein
MSAPNEVPDTEYTIDPVCPYCGAEQSDAWEWELDEGEAEERGCEACERRFKVEVFRTTRYTTWRPEDEA